MSALVPGGFPKAVRRLIELIHSEDERVALMQPIKFMTVLGARLEYDPNAKGAQRRRRGIASRVRDGEEQPPFRYKDEGTLATIGRHAAIVAFCRERLAKYKVPVRLDIRSASEFRRTPTGKVHKASYARSWRLTP
jgi:NADH dehydrogenase FAD-containing subunit